MSFPGSESVVAALTPPADPLERARWLAQWRNARILAGFFALALVCWVIRLYAWSLPVRTGIAAEWLPYDTHDEPTAALLAEGGFWISVIASAVLAIKSDYRPGMRKGRSRIQRSLLRDDGRPEPFAPHEKPDAYALHAVPFLVLAGLCQFAIRYWLR